MRVVLADDGVLFRTGLARLLTEAGVEVVAETDHPHDLPGLVDATAPDVTVVDIRMPPTFTLEGLDAARDLRRRDPGAAVLVLSQYVEAHHALTLLADGRGGVGYLLKDRVARVGDILTALRRVAAGDTVVDPSLVEEMLTQRRSAAALHDLTDRERDVLRLVAEGRSNRAIALALHLGDRTVESHIASILDKLRLPPDAGSHRRVLAVLAYLRSPG